MKHLLDYLRFVLISPELLVALLIAAAAVIRPDLFVFFSQFVLSTDATIVVALVGVPIFLLAASYKIGDMILTSAAKNGLVKWDGYWRLKHRVYFSWILSGLNVPLTYFAWFLTHQGHSLLGTTLILGGWGVSGVSTMTLAVAKISMGDVIAKEE